MRMTVLKLRKEFFQLEKGKDLAEEDTELIGNGGIEENMNEGEEIGEDADEKAEDGEEKEGQ